MKEENLTRLLRDESPGEARAGWCCPDEMALAAYVERSLSAKERSRVELHLADCGACLEQVAFLASEPSAAAQVPASAVARARDLARASGRARWHPLVWRWGAAAASLASILVVVVLQFRQPVAPPAPTAPRIPPAASNAVAAGTTTDARVQTPAGGASAPAAAATPALPVAPPPDKVRKSAAVPLATAMTSPVEDSTQSPHDLEFRWRGVPGALYYEIRLVTDDGTVVWQERANGTAARLPSDHPLEPGTKYFVWVLAHLSGGGTVRSAAVPFFSSR
jgi:hypothetical protein